MLTESSNSLAEGSGSGWLFSVDNVTPSVLRSKQITKPCHEHHVYVIMHVMEWIDEVLQPKMINKNVKWEAITQLMYIK